jgi:hypothetical protein
MFKISAQKVLTLIGHSENMRSHTERKISHMRTKTLLLTAALSAAGLATSMAQVYSVNAVGYVNQSVPAGGYAIISVPLNGNPNNDINNTIPLPQDGSFDGANIYRFDAPNQRYRGTMSFVSGLGWLAEDPADVIINPGEGFFLQNVAGVALPLTFVGDVPAGSPTLNPIQGGNKYTITAALVPKGGRVGWEGLAGSLEFPADDGDSLYVFDKTTQRYKETYAYVTGLGWLHDVDPPEGPDMQPGNGFWIQKQAPGRDWRMTFTVN